jgi:hypothetical protein
MTPDRTAPANGHGDVPRRLEARLGRSTPSSAYVASEGPRDAVRVLRVIPPTGWRLWSRHSDASFAIEALAVCEVWSCPLGEDCARTTCAYFAEHGESREEKRVLVAFGEGWKLLTLSPHIELVGPADELDVDRTPQAS